MKTFNTKSGITLTISDIKGKDYMVVAQRLLWFRHELPNWTIETEIVEIGPDHCLFKANIKDDTGKLISTAHKMETRSGFPDFIEKSETGAIGRALGFTGFGTQYCGDELDEGQRLADSPLERVRASQATKVVIAAQANESINSEFDNIQLPTLSTLDTKLSTPDVKDNPFTYVIDVGKYDQGKTIEQIGIKKAENFVNWLKKAASNPDQPRTLSHQEKYFIFMVEEFKRMTNSEDDVRF